ncbi:hypothetical protein ASG03_10030 [Rhizobium sp. Leaf341]|nr:hypothetical protein ASG03_10030 [Rhizobium sp. Leaf341]
MAKTLREILQEISDNHARRMRDDPCYRIMVAYMRTASEPIDHPRHYDRDGYCDNPARGY